MSNPFSPGNKKVSAIGKSMSEDVVKQVAQSLGVDASKINLKMDNAALLSRASVAYENKDFTGYIACILRGSFLSVLCDDYTQGLSFAREFLRTQNPEAANKITETEVAQIAALYAASLGSADAEKIKTEQDAEIIIRAEFIVKSHIHAAAKLVSRFARFNAFAEGTHGSMSTLKSFASLLDSSRKGEATQANLVQNISNLAGAAQAESNKRYAHAVKENTPAAYSVFVMQVIYDYCVFVNIGLYDVKALMNLVARIDAFALYNDSVRIGDIATMIREDFRPNQQYGEE